MTNLLILQLDEMFEEDLLSSSVQLLGLNPHDLEHNLEWLVTVHTSKTQCLAVNYYDDIKQRTDFDAPHNNALPA